MKEITAKQPYIINEKQKQILICIRDNVAISIADIAAKTGFQKDLVKRYALDSRKLGLVTSKPKVCRTHLYSITAEGNAKIMSESKVVTYRAWDVPLLRKQFLRLQFRNKAHKLVTNK